MDPIIERHWPATSDAPAPSLWEWGHRWSHERRGLHAVDHRLRVPVAGAVPGVGLLLPIEEEVVAAEQVQHGDVLAPANHVAEVLPELVALPVRLLNRAFLAGAGWLHRFVRAGDGLLALGEVLDRGLLLEERLGRVDVL